MAYLLELQAVHLRVHVAGKAFVWQQKLVCGSKSFRVAAKACVWQQKLVCGRKTCVWLAAAQHTYLIFKVGVEI